MRSSDNEYFRYFASSERDRQWGWYVSGVGSTHVPPSYRKYPASLHPNAYMYHWERGRVLVEYQTLYIVRGQGQFESRAAGIRKVAAGTVILLFPGDWHRYRPAPETGWDEYWVSFGGESMEQLVRRGFFSPKEPLLRTGVDEAILHPYLELMDQARTGSVGFQQRGAANIHQILAAASAAVQSHGIGNRGEDLVHRAKTMLEERIEGWLSIPQVAKSLHLGEDQLRRLFKRHTGMGPYQYYLQLKMHRARQMLSADHLTVKQIAHALGFESPFHFSKAFKQRTGMSPTQWRSGGWA